MKVLTVATANPSLHVTQDESLAFILKHIPMKSATRTLYEKVFQNKSIERRSFGLETLEAVLEKDYESINTRFQRAATNLSSQSLTQALENSSLQTQDLDYLVTATCTGYLCPGLSSYIIEKLDLKPTVHHADLAGMGCGAAIPALKSALNFVRAHPGARAAVVCTEICSAAMYADDAPDLVISNGIFADGSAAAIVSSADSDPAALTVIDVKSLIQPAWRESLRFRTKNGYLRNVLSKEVPMQAAAAVSNITQTLLAENNLNKNDVRHWLVHSGGEKILGAIAEEINLNGELDPSRTILREHGNMSSPTVLYVLEHVLKTKKPKSGEWGVLASFGAGFSAHAALLKF